MVSGRCSDLRRAWVRLFIHLPAASSLLLVGALAGSAAERQGVAFLSDCPTSDGQHLVLGAMAEAPAKDGALALRGIPLAATGGGGRAWIEPPPLGQGWRLVRDAGTAAGRGPRLALQGGSGPVTVVLPGVDGKTLTISVIPPPGGDPDDLVGVRAAAYRRMTELGLPGAAWFRHLAGDPARAIPAWRRESLIDSTFALPGTFPADPDPMLASIFAGGEQPADQPVAALDSVKPPTPGTAPEQAGLWALLPADRPALVAPTMGAFAGALGHAESWSGPLHALLRGAALERGVIRRIEFQLALDLGQLVRLLDGREGGPAALVADDPDLLGGTGVAILITGQQQVLLTDVLQARWAAQTGAGSVAAIKGVIDGVSWRGVATADRSVQVMMAPLSPTVLVLANSPVVLEAVIKSAAGKIPSLAVQPEVTALRQKLAGDGAVLAVPQAAADRWSAPAYAVAASRRLRARSAMADLQCIAISGGDLKAAVETHPELGAVTLDRGMIRSERYGSLRFLTPLAEMLPTAITAEEAAAWKRWHDTFRRRGGWSAIPFGLRADPGDDDLQVTVLLPGNGRTPSRNLMPANPALALGGALDRLPKDWRNRLLPWKTGDPLSAGDGTGWMWSEGPVDPTTDPLGWPLVLRFGAADSKRSTTMLKALLEQSRSKGIAATFDDQTKRLRLAPLGNGVFGSQPLLAVAAPDGLLLATEANAAALDAALARPSRPALAQATIRLTAKAVPGLALADPAWAPRQLAWGVLPILGEWKRRQPSEDAAQTHERLWGDRPVELTNGQFLFDPVSGIVASPAFGSPWGPVEGRPLLERWKSLPGLTVHFRWSDFPSEPAKSVSR